MNMPGTNNGFSGFRAPERPAGPYGTTFGTMPLHYSSAPVPAPPAARPSRNTTMTVLWVVLAAFVLIAGTFGTLYILESGKRAEAAAALETSQRELTDARSAREDAEAQLGEKDGDLRAAEKSRDEARDQVAALTKCRDATRAFMDAVAADKPDASKEINDMVNFCS